MNARDLMTTDVACVTGDASIQEVAMLMRDNDCGEIPIVDSNRGRALAGVITDRDIVVRVLAGNKDVSNCRVSDVMTANVTVASPDMDLVEVARLMGENQIRRIPVVDGDRRLLGILSFADVTRAAGENVAGSTIQDISEPRKEGGSESKKEGGREANFESEFDKTPRSTHGNVLRRDGYSDASPLQPS